MTLVVAIAYGGRWDIARPPRSSRVAAQPGKCSRLPSTRQCSLNWRSAEPPDPDLFIRTGGEQRISNFLLWNLAYTELYFCDTLWPDFGDGSFERRWSTSPAATPLRPDRAQVRSR